MGVAAAGRVCCRCHAACHAHSPVASDVPMRKIKATKTMRPIGLYVFSSGKPW